MERDRYFSLELVSKSSLKVNSWRKNSARGSRHAAAVLITEFLDKVIE